MPPCSVLVLEVSVFGYPLPFFGRQLDRFLLIECCKSLSDPRGFPFWREPLLDQLFQPCRLRRTDILSHTAPILAHSNTLPKKTSSPQNRKGGKTPAAGPAPGSTGFRPCGAEKRDANPGNDDQRAGA